MNKFSKIFSQVFTACLISLFCSLIAFPNIVFGKSVEIAFTSDMHSYIESYDAVIDGEVTSIGGFSRVKTYFDSLKSQNENALILDCGDIVMGTLPQALMDTDAIELRQMIAMGYDALTYGNHEFDYGAKALSDMYSLAAKEQGNHPQFVICNIDWNAGDSYTEALKQGMSEYGYSDYVVINKGGVNIAVTGVLGYDAIKCAPTCELTFIDPIEAVKNTVATIKAKEQVDMIICLSHSGTGEKLGKTEDEVLAKEVPDLDLIISGHTHTVLKKAVIVGNTTIVSCGSYGKYVGHVNLTMNNSGRWSADDYKLVLMNNSVKADDSLQASIDEMLESVDEKVLASYGYSQDDIIAYNDNIIFEEADDLYEIHDETRLGNIISDAYRYIANSTPTGQETQFDASVAPSGTIRGTLLPGNITIGKAFEILSLGKGPDGVVGYPLVSLYLTGEEIKTVTEVDGTISDIMKSARLYTSGVCYEFNSKRMLLNKVSDVWLNYPVTESSRTEIEDDKLYRVVTDYYSMSMLGSVTDLSKGILSIVPKDKDGNPITDYNDTIIYDKDGKELKAWVALAEYLKSFPEEGHGYSTIPDYYETTHGRKVSDKSFNPVKLLKNANAFSYGLIIVVVVIILIVVLIVRSNKKRKSRKKVFIE